MESKIVLQTENLSIGYEQQRKVNCIAKGIDLTLRKGQLIAIVGANGIGKSTLLRTVTGLQKPLDGQILLNQQHLKELDSMTIAKELSLVLTEKLPPSNLTVYELIALGRQPYTNWIGTLSVEDYAKIEEAIALTQTQDLINKRHYEISDGQLQIVMIARALAQDTPLIVLDEPTTHLDLQHKVSLFKLLKKLTHETKKCILFSTHDIDMAIQLSDEIIVMTKGECIQDTPCNLISKGTFDLLFKDENITFDAERGKFNIT
jgi:iron complex transport system ATP-binding protein